MQRVNYNSPYLCAARKCQCPTTHYYGKKFIYLATQLDGITGGRSNPGTSRNETKFSLKRN